MTIKTSVYSRDDTHICHDHHSNRNCTTYSPFLLSMRYIPKTLPISIKLHPQVQLHNSHPIRLPPLHKRPIMTTITIQPIFSADSDIPSLTTSLSTLLHPDGRWQLTPKGNGVERTIKFKTFKKTWVCSVQHRQSDDKLSSRCHKLTFHETGVHEHHCRRM